VRGQVRVRETETRRHIRAAKLEGLEVERIVISSDGTVALITSHGNGKQEAAPEVKPADAPRLRSWD
jgi:hypothetical protein